MKKACQNNIFEGDNAYREYYIEIKSYNNNYLKKYRYLKTIKD